jgi:hypothetical protein
MAFLQQAWRKRRARNEYFALRAFAAIIGAKK